MSYENRIKSTFCKCGREKLMTGHHAQYNAKLKDGTQCCNTCKLEEILGSFAARPEVAKEMMES